MDRQLLNREGRRRAYAKGHSRHQAGNSHCCRICGLPVPPFLYNGLCQTCHDIMRYGNQFMGNQMPRTLSSVMAISLMGRQYAGRPQADEL